MIHCKLLIVDGFWTLVGSSNLDNRSLRLNDEANMNVMGSGFAAQQRAIFENDKARAQTCQPRRMEAPLALREGHKPISGSIRVRTLNGTDDCSRTRRVARKRSTRRSRV